MIDIEVCDVSTFVKAITDIGKNENKIKVFKDCQLLFRGQSNYNYELSPSIARTTGKKNDTFIRYEEKLVETAKMQLPEVFKNDFEPIEMLALLQHYGIPTRLLDVTENALVALFFACIDNQCENGEVIVFLQDVDNVKTRLVVNAIAETYRFAKYDYTYLDTFYKAITYQPYFLEQKHLAEKMGENEQDGAKWLKFCLEDPIFACANIRSMRQQTQSGKYIVFPNDIDYEQGSPVFVHSIKPIQKNHKCILGRVLIKAEHKVAIIEELRSLGITKRTLFPDNIDIVCQEIKEHFV